MWESLKDIIIKLFESPLLYVGTIGVLFILLKKGLISVDTGAVKIGKTRDNERAIIAAQISYIQLHLGAISVKMVKEMKNIQPYHIKYVVEKLGDEMVRRCAVNHISSDPVYLQDTYLTLIDIVRKRAAADYFWGPDFEQFVKDEVSIMVTQLLSIRSRMSR